MIKIKADMAASARALANVKRQLPLRKRKHEPSLHFAEGALSEARRVGPDKLAETIAEVLRR